MKNRIVLPVAALAGLVIGGAAVGSHVLTVPPAQVPTGMLVAHTSIDDVPLSALARAAAPRGTDLFVQHVRLGANVAVGWHTHPGPALVGIAAGSLTYEDGQASDCRRIVYRAGEGFVDRGFGHVHRVVAGEEGVDFYVAYLLPPGAATHVVSASVPGVCAS